MSELQNNRPVDQVAAAAQYRDATTGQLRRAAFTNITELISADIGHFFVRAGMFHHQIYEILMGRSAEFDWDPDIKGKRPDLDLKEQNATEQLRLIWREMSMRRSVRSNMRSNS